MFYTVFPRLLLILALLVAQAGGLAHGISHALAEQDGNSYQSLPSDKHSGFCAVFAHIGSAIGSGKLNITISESRETFRLNFINSCIPETLVAFPARAPPYSA